MGLIGWADAPAIAEENAPKADSNVLPLKEGGGLALTETSDVVAGSYSSEVAFENNDNASISEETDAAVCFAAPVDEHNNVDAVSDGGEQVASFELLEAIRNLKLKHGAECSESRYDISSFELHEIKFLYTHAMRFGFDDYFSAVKEVFAVKHRILDEGGDIDSVDSPNLDELLSYVEAKYDEAFGGEEQ